MATYGEIMFNAQLPDDVRIEGGVTKKKLQQAMVELAKRDPEAYAETIQKVKRFGDEIATLEGISVGLDDIMPDYERRDPIMQDAMERVKATDDPEEKRRILTETENKILEITQNHPSEMALMARSGGRGSVAQLMKTVGSPVAVTNSQGEVVPWLVERSYAQGLSPGSFWIAASEARRNAIKSTNSVVEPGAVAKVVVTNMESTVVVSEDCGTSAGIEKSTDDNNIVDRYLAEDAGDFPRDTLITAAVAQEMQKRKIKTVVVRSPMTCDEHDGVCQRCMGIDAYGNHFGVGNNVGVRAAQAITEPLTQFSLDAKHGVRLSGGGKKQLAGLHGFRMLTEVPKSYTNRAALAQRDGTVTAIDKAPQGGHFITVSGKRHYTPPGLPPIVKVNQVVELGDALSEGTPMPDEVVAAKGVGEGRRYLSSAVNDLFKRQGVNIDHRHTELLARRAMNYVEVTNDPTGTFLEGDVVSYNAVQKKLRETGKEVPLGKAEGRLLAAPVLHYTEGTRLTPSVITTLRARGVSSVSVSDGGPEIQPIMKSLIQTPLLDQGDWLNRLSHRYLKKTITEGAAFGAETNLESTSPVAAFVADSNFGAGHQGKYASVAEFTESDLEKIAAASPLRSRIMQGAKKVLFGSGADAVGSATSPRVVSRGWGAADASGVEARRLQRAIGDDDTFKSLGIVDDTGTVTDQGRRRMNLIQQARNASPEESERLVAQMQDVGLDPGQLSPEQWDRINKVEGGALKNVARSIGGMMFGDAPIQTTVQRFRQGGIAGKGGLLTGDMAIDADLRRDFRILKEDWGKNTGWQNAKGVGGLAWGGLGEGAGKYFGYAVPAMAVYDAATAPEHPEESRLENMALPIADTVGWGLGGGLGMQGGSLISTALQKGTSAVTRAIDPKTRAIDAQKKQDEARRQAAQAHAQRARMRGYAIPGSQPPLARPMAPPQQQMRPMAPQQQQMRPMAPPMARPIPAQPTQQGGSFLDSVGNFASDTGKTMQGHPLFGMAGLAKDVGNLGIQRAQNAWSSYNDPNQR